LFVDSQRPDNHQSERQRSDRQGSGGEYKSQVLAATNIVDLIGRTVSLKKAGKNYVGLCPFHSEKTPSFNVMPDKQFYYCHGCKKTGDVIKFVMERDRVVFLDALHHLGDAAGIERPKFSPEAREKAGQRKQLQDANSAACMFFEKLLAEPVIGKAARDYLLERGFSAESVKNFHIGFAADAWDGLLKSPSMKAFSPASLVEAGLVKARESGSGFFDFFRNRLMFPIRDESGRTIAFGGRVMPGTDAKPKYLNSPDTALFSKSRNLFGLDLARQKIVETRTVAVVEGYTDVVMAHQYGASNVVSPLGTSLGAAHVQMLRRFAEKIVLLFDADSAGDNATNRAVELFLTQPVEIAIASLPDGLDPDEFLLAQGLPAFESILKNATDALTHTWKQLIRRFNASGNDLTGQQKAVQDYLELLAGAREAGPVDQMRWGSALARVSRLTDIPVDQLNRMFRPKKKIRVNPAASDAVVETAADYQGEAGHEPTKVVPTPRKPAGPLNARDRCECWILAILLNEPHRWMHVQRDVKVQHFADQTRRRLAEVYWQHQRDEGEPVFAELLATLNETEPELAELAVNLIRDSEILADADARLKEAMDYLADQRILDQERKQLTGQWRTSSPAVDQSDAELAGTAAQPDPNEVLRKQMERARKPDLRRI
jgi:DNA primase